jgi:hypothetical protein
MLNLARRESEIFARQPTQRPVLVVITSLSENFDFFFELQFLPLHRTQPRHIDGRPLCLSFDD